MGETPKKNRGGRPKADIDYALVETLAGIGCTLEEIAAACSVVPSTITRRAVKDKAFRDALERGRSNGRTTLRRWQWQSAQRGNIGMQIWLGKQMLGQRDKVAADIGADATRDDVSAAEAQVIEHLRSMAGAKE